MNKMSDKAYEIIEVAKTQGRTNDSENKGIQEVINTKEPKLDNLVFAEAVVKSEGIEKENNQTKSQDVKVMIANEKEVVVEVTNNNSAESEMKQNMSGNSDAILNDNKSIESNSHATQNFAETIFENIEHAVNEISYTKESVDTEGIMKQIVNHVKIGMSKEVTSMELQLHPESLGKLDLQVAMKDGNLVAKFITENEAIKNVIEGQLIQLKETLEEQGLKVTSVEVSVAEQGLRQDMDQNAENQDDFNESKNTSVRKINLQGIRELEDIELEQMNDEEIIATKMMLENGNTVDYTA
jgi:flagellar hook-length control protein FliK